MLKGKELGSAIGEAIDLKIKSGKAKSKAEIARHFRVQPPSVFDWINKGSIAKDKLPELWRYFSDVVGPEHWGLSSFQYDSPSLESNVIDGPEIIGMIPVISWVQAGRFCTSPGAIDPSDAEEWVPAIKKHGPHTYGLRIKGDSMVSPYPGTRSYPPGVVVYVDPDRPVENSSKVIARINESEEATFKVYSEDGGKRYLRPLNPQFETIVMDESMQICGVVVGCYWDE